MDSNKFPPPENYKFLFLCAVDSDMVGHMFHSSGGKLSGISSYTSGNPEQRGRTILLVITIQGNQGRFLGVALCDFVNWQLKFTFTFRHDK